ncbi:MAG TPA: APC family permease [Terriglobales bacterium]|nr:APC family permease [Terriglobales bacterium]
MGTTTEYFARRASGLARNVSAYDALIYNIMWMAPLGTWIYGIWALNLFPGADLPMTVLISEVVALIVGTFYAVFSSSMARSGGDYIWMSRVLHPGIGLSMNFFFNMALLSIGGATMFWVTQYSLGPMFEVLGMAPVAAFLESSNGTFIVAITLYVLFGILITRGAKITHIILWVLFILTVLAILVYNGTLLSLGTAGFKASFNSASGWNYDDVLKAGATAGYPSSTILGSTLLAVAFTYFSFTGFNSTVYYSAEIKNVRKSQFIAILGATILYMFILWIDYYVTVSVMGTQFVGSLALLFGSGNPAYKLAYPPFFQNLFRFATVGNPLAYSIVAIGFAAMSIAAPLTYVFGGTRMIFAWAFDRVVPISLAKVDTRYRSPYMAILVTVVMSIIAMVLWVYTSLLNYFLYASFGWMVMQGFASIAGIIFPWRRKDIFDAAPEIVKRKILGLPTITLLGIGTLLCSIYIGYASVAPAYEGTFNPGYLGFSISLMIIGAIIYCIAWAYRKRTGLPLELTFREIPPE